MSGVGKQRIRRPCLYASVGCLAPDEFPVANFKFVKVNYVFSDPTELLTMLVGKCTAWG